jgi:hypothetical protein
MIFIILVILALLGWVITFFASSPPAANIGMVMVIVAIIGIVLTAAVESFL